MTAMTPIVMIVTLTMLLSPAWCWSAISGAAPVTYVFIPGGGGVLRRRCSRIASTDSLASGSPWLPCRYSWT